MLSRDVEGTAAMLSRDVEGTSAMLSQDVDGTSRATGLSLEEGAGSQSSALSSDESNA